MNQPTSASAYSIENLQGALTVRRQMVLDYIRQHPGCTQNEAERDLGSGASQRTFGSRFSDLIRMGMIQESGHKPDPITGKQCLTYTVTGRQIPLPLDREIEARTSKELLNAFEEVILLEERFRVQEFQELGTQQAAAARRKKELRQMILRKMNKTHPPSSSSDQQDVAPSPPDWNSI